MATRPPLHSQATCGNARSQALFLQTIPGRPAHEPAEPAREADERRPLEGLAGAPGPGPTSLDSLLPHNCNKPPERCGRWSLLKVRDDGDGFYYVPLGCGRWNCPRCGPYKAGKLRRGIARAAEEHGLTRFLTLTLDTSGIPDDALVDGGIAYIRDAWRKLRVSLARRAAELGESRCIVFIAFLELQARGVAHLHVLVDRYIPHAWIRDAWVAVGGGRIVDVRHVDLHRVSRYLARYVTQEKLGGLPPGVRRYSTARGIALVRRVASTWSVVRMSLGRIAERVSVLRWPMVGCSADIFGLSALVVARAP